jgi:hypothetical protein
LPLTWHFLVQEANVTRAAEYDALLNAVTGLAPPIPDLRAAADWIERAVAVLRAVEWSGVVDGFKCCPDCHATIGQPHETDCDLAPLIGAKVQEG